MNHVLAICVGACVGALGRWQLGVWLNPGAALPWGTLAANWIGAYAVGLAVEFFQAHTGIDPAWRLFIVTGLLGALTTFSTFSAEAIALLQQGRVVTALLHAGLHLFGSLLLAWLGVLSGQTWWAKGT
ncbi:MAG TPA: fluoride efflux transporter CrcB [Burkholderiaceae bacterium]|nr:fluoride efflux transporter CrcB [Burkholderiaceae bacterium]